MKAEMSPMRSAMSASDRPSTRIQSLRSMGLGSPSGLPRAPVVLPPGRLAEALAVIVVEVLGVLPSVHREAALIRIANRMDGFGRAPGSNEAAALLRAVAGALMRMEC